MQRSREAINGIVIEHSVLETLNATLDLASTTLIEVYPFPDEDLIEEGGYEAVHAYSRAIISQIQSLRDTLRCYQLCLRVKDEDEDGGPPPGIPF